uniref:Unknown protein from 2D-PAGE of needles (Fragments) n=1 Tax=Pinus pinaster TaxID=71647 RepID=UN03_PINPS|nr:RecName: Full=Unknown protein from 2D-PAGE of needles; AltName: Full=N140 [Pinus pinaster]
VENIVIGHMEVVACADSRVSFNLVLTPAETVAYGNLPFDQQLVLCEIITHPNF